MKTVSDYKEIQKFSKEGIRLIVDEEDYRQFIKIFLENNQDPRQNDNFINSLTEIDFTRQVMLVSYEAIIKSLFNTDFGYVIEFQDQIRGYSEYFYPLLVKKNIKAENCIFLNKSLGPYFDTKFYPDFLNNIIDLFHDLNTNNSHNSELSINDLKKEVSIILNSCKNSIITQQNISGRKIAKVVIVGLDDFDNKESETTCFSNKKRKKIIESKLKEEDNKNQRRKVQKKI